MSITFLASFGAASIVHGLLSFEAQTLLTEFWLSVLYPSLVLSIIFLNIPLLILIVAYYQDWISDRGGLYLYAFLSFVGSLAVGVFIHTLFFFLTSVGSFVRIVVFPSVLLSGIISGVMLTVMLIYPTYKGGEERRQVEDALVFTVGFASILAAAGMSMERVIERVASITTNVGTKRNLSRVIRNLEVFGQDIRTAILDASDHSASLRMAKILENMMVAAQTGGELFSYLVFETRQQFLNKRQKLDRTMTSLIYLGEIYVAVFVVGPIVLILMLTLMSSFGGAISGFSPVDQMNLLVFLGIPVGGAIYALILDQVIGESEF
ncbi:MAG: type II secretion system F family protein [Candidatus Geothermarchaeales archaeon]